MSKSDFLFNSDDNIQKSYINVQGTVLVEGFSGSMSGTFTYNHDLGYIPASRAWYEGISGAWFPLANMQLSDAATPLLDVMGTMTLTTSSLILNMQNFSASNVNVNVRIRIYLDK